MERRVVNRDAVSTTYMPISKAHREAIVSGELGRQFRTDRHCSEKLGLDSAGDTITIALDGEELAEGEVYLFEVERRNPLDVNDLGGMEQAKKTLLCTKEEPRYRHILSFLCGYRDLVCLQVRPYQGTVKGSAEKGADDSPSEKPEEETAELLF